MAKSKKKHSSSHNKNVYFKSKTQPRKLTEEEIKANKVSEIMNNKDSQASIKKYLLIILFCIIGLVVAVGLLATWRAAFIALGIIVGLFVILIIVAYALVGKSDLYKKTLEQAKNRK